MCAEMLGNEPLPMITTVVVAICRHSWLFIFIFLINLLAQAAIHTWLAMRKSLRLLLLWTSVNTFICAGILSVIIVAFTLPLLKLMEMLRG